MYTPIDREGVQRLDSGTIKELVCKWKEEWERKKGIFFRGKERRRRRKRGRREGERKSKENFNDRRRNRERMKSGEVEVEKSLDG